MQFIICRYLKNGKGKTKELNIAFSGRVFVRPYGKVILSFDELNFLMLKYAFNSGSLFSNNETRLAGDYLDASFASPRRKRTQVE